MTLVKWCASRHTCPKYIVHCTCNNHDEEESSGLSLFDWWSFAHIFWGAMYSLPLIFGVSPVIALFITGGMAIFYECLENSEAGVCLFGLICCTPKYEGDNFWNSVADVCCCMVGYLIVFMITTILSN